MRTRFSAWQHFSARSTYSVASYSSGFGPATSQTVNEVVPSSDHVPPLSVETKNLTYSCEPDEHMPPCSRDLLDVDDGVGRSGSAGSRRTSAARMLCSRPGRLLCALSSLPATVPKWFASRSSLNFVRSFGNRGFAGARRADDARGVAGLTGPELLVWTLSGMPQHAVSGQRHHLQPHRAAASRCNQHHHPPRRPWVLTHRTANDKW